jgi:hypothetical protein
MVAGNGAPGLIGCPVSNDSPTLRRDSPTPGNGGGARAGRIANVASPIFRVAGQRDGSIDNPPASIVALA